VQYDLNCFESTVKFQSTNHLHQMCVICHFYAKYADVQILAEERKLSELECPLLVQLNWGKDDREGRFLLKREIDKTTAVRFWLLSFYNMQIIPELLC